ncbi:MAG: serine/threonine protein kinase [Myxococcaceae bacterium]|nr:serine/threonine protein kinase [Myxococcaceae bacterium]
MTALSMLPPPTDPSSALIAGRYGLVRQLAVGGMAEVWLARQRGLEGFEKLVVVKRILPHLANDPGFVQMFLDEARTAADLRHSNIASVTDVGTEAGAYFIAMEYLHGQDLTHIVQRCKVRGERIPIQHAMQMISEAAQGLDYAHRKVDRHGAAQQIVHRDVSPQNVLVTYEGATKVLDFGIASASHRGTHTEAGVVKGKYAYMSPEQFDGAVLDARSDLFSLGVVLWELVTLQRLFWRPSDAETLRAVMECRVPPPSKLQPECPPELEALIFRALARNPARRFPSCAEFSDALEALLETLRLAHSPSRVGSWLRGMFPEHTLDPTETPAAPPVLPEAPTRNEKFRPIAYPGSKTHQVPSREGLVNGRAWLGLGSASSAFVGRAAELAQLATELDAGARLVTVTGAAGQGKSRLAARWVELHPQGWKATVELAEVRDAGGLVEAVTRACGLAPDGLCETAAQLLSGSGRLLAALGPAQLVLDNLDLAGPAAAETVARWLDAAPQLSLLVTRRESLGLADERVLPLPGLGTEGADSEAMRLFSAHLQRAGLAAPSLEAERAQVGELCRRLEGLPRAIELVAARADPLSPAALLERLEEPLTLAGVIGWTCQLLSPSEREALGALSVFRGGFTPEAARQVLGLETAEEARFQLEALGRKALLRPWVALEAPGRARLRMPEEVQRWAAAHLEAGAEAAAVHARHVGWALRLGAPVAAERDNLRAVFERAQATCPATADSAAIALQALHRLESVLTRVGPWGANLELLESAIAAATRAGAAAPHLVRAMQQRANLQRNRGQPRQAMAGLSEALSVVREAGDRALEARVLCDWALACFASGDVDGARTGLDQALELARAVGDQAFEVRVLSEKATVCVARRELTQALACCDEALPLARSLGDAASEARVLGTVGSLFLEERRTELARAFFSDAVARSHESDQPQLEGYFLGKLAQALAESNELEAARAKVGQALKLLREVCDPRHEGQFLSFSAWLSAQAGEPEAAKAALKASRAKLVAAKDPLLLAAHGLRKMQVRVICGVGSVPEAWALLHEVRVGRGGARALIAQSEEVRLAALQLDRTLAQGTPPRR